MNILAFPSIQVSNCPDLVMAMEARALVGACLGWSFSSISYA